MPRKRAGGDSPGLTGGVIGIDPGSVSGSIAYVSDSYVDSWAISDLTLRDQWLLLRRLRGVFQARKAVLEKVGARPKQGVSSTCKFCRNAGQLEAFLVALEIPYETPTPQKWQKVFSLTKKSNETGTQKKNRHKEAAQKLWPAMKIIHKNADALLISEYGRRQP